MSIDQQLRDTVPTTLAPLDHANLQRRGRNRRWTTRAATGVATMGVATAVVGVAIAVRPTPVDVAGEGLPAPGTQAASSPSPEVEATADPQIVGEWERLTHEQVVAKLYEVLDDSPARPDHLESIEVTEFDDGERIITSVPIGSDDFPVIHVSHEDFVADGQFETPALLPTWTQDAARNALDSLAATDLFGYDGVTVDARGRTVLEFDAFYVDQQIWIDPASGYTAGVRFGDSTRAQDLDGLGRATDAEESVTVAPDAP